ncbi:hypothetical protein T439DRAFT_383058 [Meredithblackwellia eburnea MCA 4105]
MVHHLPPELLLQVFRSLPHPDTKLSRYPDWFGMYNTNLLNFSLVCKDWNDPALAVLYGRMWLYWRPKLGTFLLNACFSSGGKPPWLQRVTRITAVSVNSDDWVASWLSSEEWAIEQELERADADYVHRPFPTMETAWDAWDYWGGKWDKCFLPDGEEEENDGYNDDFVGEALFFDFITHMPALSALDLHEFEFSLSPDHLPILAPVVRNLTHLTIDPGFQVREGPNNLLGLLSSVKSLKLTWKPFDEYQTALIDHPAIANLEHLRLHRLPVRPQSGHEDPPVDIVAYFSSNPPLRIVTLDITFPMEADDTLAQFKLRLPELTYLRSLRMGAARLDTDLMTAISKTSIRYFRVVGIPTLKQAALLPPTMRQVHFDVRAGAEDGIQWNSGVCRKAFKEVVQWKDKFDLKGLGMVYFSFAWVNPNHHTPAPHPDYVKSWDELVAVARAGCEARGCRLFVHMEGRDL